MKDEQYVYIHRNAVGEPVYIGRGKDQSRAVSHEGDDLSKLLAQHGCTAEIAGPFQEESAAADVEAALISAFQKTPKIADKLVNKAPGVSRATFRPIGVPLELADRLLEPELNVEELLAATSGKSAIIVLITRKMTTDGRGGYDLANVPSNKTIQDRMVRSWQLGRQITAWKARPERMPTILLAVSGPIKFRVVVASLAIDRDAEWKPAGAGLFEVPIKTHPHNAGLDYGRLRGRRIPSKGLVKFGGVKSKFFCIVPCA